MSERQLPTGDDLRRDLEDATGRALTAEAALRVAYEALTDLTLTHEQSNRTAIAAIGKVLGDDR